MVKYTYMNLNFTKEKKISSIILGSALVIAGFLVFYDSESFKKSLADVKKEKEAAMQAEKFSLEQENKNIGILNTEDLSALLTGKKSSNLTQKLADDLATGFMDANPSGVADGEVITPDSKALLEQAASDYQKEISSSGIFVGSKDLKISYNNSQDKIYDYYVSYQDVINQYSEKINLLENLEMFADTNNSSYLESPVIYLRDAIDELKGITIPSDFASLHQDMINIFITIHSVLDSLISANDDPLKASSGLLLIQETLNKLSSLGEDFMNELENHGFDVQYSQ